MKALKIFLIVIVSFIVLLLIIPFAFKGKILNIVHSEINKNLNARVEFADLRLSLIRNFPNLSLALTDLSVVGVEDFQNDTLVSFSSFRTVVDIKSVIIGDEISVRSVILDQPGIKARVLEDGRPNWDIMISPEEDPVTDDAGTYEFIVDLQKFQIRNGRIEYDDESLDFRTTLGGFNLIMKGDLTQDLTELDIAAISDSFNLWFDGIHYITDTRLSVNTLFDADMNDFMFTVKDSEIFLNELEMGMDGYFAMPADDIDMDIKFFSADNDFREFLSLVPAVYMAGFEDLQATGNVTVEGFITGKVSDETVPSVGLDVIVEDGSFSYPDLPESLDNMFMNLNIHYDGVDEDLTTVDLNSLHIEMAGNPFDMKLSIRTPVSDMFVDVSSAGTIDFTSLSDVIPLGDITLRGLFETDLFFTGYMSDIENEFYEQLLAGGSMRLTAFRYSDPEFPFEISIPGAMLNFTPRYVELTDFESEMGESDIRMSGRMENFIPYIFNDGTLRGNMLLSSSMLDVNELLGVGTEETEDTVAMSVVEIPGNIDFALASSVDRVLFDEMDISQLKGRIIVRDSKLLMEGVNMNMLEGSVSMSGEYNTQDMTAPFIDFEMDINSFDIPSSFNTFNTVQQLTPLAEDLRGSFSSSVDLYTILDDDMMPVMNTLDARGSLRTSSVEVLSSETFNKLSQALNLKEDRENILRDINISFVIANGRVHVDPFDVSMGPVDMVIGGSQGIDRTLNYTVRMNIPRSAFGQGAEQLIDNLTSSAAERGLDIQPGETVSVNANITGSFDDPQVSLDMQEAARSTMEQVRDQIRQQVEEEVEQRVEEVEDRAREEVSERAEQILQEAELRADRVRKAAEDAAAEIRKEAEANATRIEEEAAGRGAIARAAADRTAEAIRQEAAKQADALIREADERAVNIIEEARKEAEKIQ
ncbi:MAG: AsmA-like C-terminal region-containing protein [Bacteroidales bacterium]